MAKNEWYHLTVEENQKTAYFFVQKPRRARHLGYGRESIIKKNEHYYLEKAADAICDAIFYLNCASIKAVGADADIQDRSTTTLIRALRYSLETIAKIGEYTYEKNT